MYSSLKRLLIFIRLNRLIFELQRKPLTWEVGIHVYPDATNCKENKQNRERDVRMSWWYFFFFKFIETRHVSFHAVIEILSCSNLRFYSAIISAAICHNRFSYYSTCSRCTGQHRSGPVLSNYNETVRPNFYQRT